MSPASPDRVPVLIVGGGPTGLTLSALLSRHGVGSLLVERNPGTCDHPQARFLDDAGGALRGAVARMLGAKSCPVDPKGDAHA